MLKRNLIANYLGSGWSALMGLVFLPVYIHYVGIEAYGLIGVFASLQVWFLLLDMGLSLTLNREMALFTTGKHTLQSIHNLLRSLEVVYLCVAVLLALLVVGFSSWIATDWLNVETLSTETVTQSLQITGFIIAFRWMSTLYRSAITGLQRQVWLNSVMAFLATVRGLGSIAVLAYVSPTIQAFFIYQGIVYSIETVALAWRTRQYLPAAPQRPRFCISAFKGIWHFAIGITALTGLETVLTQIDKFLLSTLLSLEQFGYFIFATTVVGVITILTGPIINVAIPRFTELIAAKNEQSLIVEYHKFAQLLTIIIVPPALFLCFFSREILLLWTRDPATAQATAPIVSLWVIGTAINGIMQLPFTVQIAYGWTRLLVIGNMIAVAIIVPAFLIFVPRYGVMAAAWIWLATNTGYMLFMVSVMHARILRNEKWKWYLADVFVPSLVGLSIMLGMITLATEHIGTSQLILAIFLVIGAIFVLAATATATQLGRQVMVQTKTIFTKLISIN